MIAKLICSRRPLCNFLTILSLFIGVVHAQGTPVVASGAFCSQQPGWQSVSIGSSGMWNAATTASGTFTVSGIGLQIGGTADSFGFAYARLSGDGSIVARLVSVQGGTLAGVMIRESLDEGSTNATTATWDARGTTYFDARATTDGNTAQAASVSTSLPIWLKLVRSGNTFSSYSSSDGVAWTQAGTGQTISMMQNVYIGLAVTGGSVSSPATATFDHVSMTSSGTPLPCLASVSTTSGEVGSRLLIVGSGFGNTQGNSQVLLNGTPVSVNFWNNNTISATIPTEATSGTLFVHGAGPSSSFNDSNNVMFTVGVQASSVWGWMDYDLGSEKYTLTAGTGSGGGSGGSFKMVYGSSSYSNESFVVNGSGLQVYGGSDTSHFLYQSLSGDGSIVARLVNVQGTAGWWAAAGLMIRETLSGGSASVAIVDSPGPGTFGFQARPTANGNTNQIQAIYQTPAYWMKLARSGNSFMAFTSPDGINWTQLGASQTISMASNVYVGLSVTSADNSTLAAATFDNVSVRTSTGSSPFINTLSSTTGSSGNQVLISGSGFGNGQGNSQVTLNTVPVTINFWSDTYISVTIPTGATSGDLVVSVAPSMNDSNPVWFTVTSQPLPTGWFDRNVGTTSLAGASGYSSGTFTISGSGYQINSSADAFHFAYQQLSGDGSITARVVSMQGDVGWWAGAGVMIRETMDAGATNVAILDSPQPTDFGFQVRTSTNGSSNQFGAASVVPPYWVKLTRSGSNFSGYVSSDGATWSQVGSTQTINMAQSVYVGLAVESGSATSQATATFDNVSVVSSIQSPTIGSLQPTSGSEGDSVIISGSNFGSTQGNSTLSFGGVQATAISSWADNQITATVPSGAATGQVSVVVNGLQSNQSAVFIVNTNIAGISPNTGDVLSQFQITGNGFGASQCQSTVTLNGASAPVLAWSTTSITILVPSGATTGEVVVTVGGIAITGPSFTVTTTTPPSPTIPSISGVSPSSGNTGTQVTINGSGFGANQGTGSLVLGSALGIVTLWHDDMIQANISVGSTSGIVQVQQGGYASNSLSFTVTGLPNISGIDVNNGMPGDPITISGSGFGNSQGNGMVRVGTLTATVTNWRDGTIQATVSAGSASGVVQVLQNGVWSNSLPFTINTPHIDHIDNASGGAGATVTISGNGFGSSQGNGVVWIGSMPGNVTGWGNGTIVATVAANSVSGVVKVQQNGIWSNALSFTVPVTLQGGTQVTLLPNIVSMVVGDTRTIQALDSNNQPLSGLTWASSDTTIATLSTDDPPIITAVAAGTVTITAGGASADVTVYTGPTLPVGTVIWSNPGNGSGVSSIVPAVPSPIGVADVFALQADCNVNALTKDGVLAWKMNVGTYTAQDGSTACNSFLPDFQGGLVVYNPQSIMQVNGSGVANTPYTVTDQNDTLAKPVIHTNGTVFSIYTSMSTKSANVVAIDPSTGQEQFRVPMDQTSNVSSCSGDICTGLSYSLLSPPSALVSPIVAGDGYAYIPYQYQTTTSQWRAVWMCLGQHVVGTVNTLEHLMLLRIGSDGSSSKIDVKDWKSTAATQQYSNSCEPVVNQTVQNGIVPVLQQVPAITDADQGTLLSWEADFPAGCYPSCNGATSEFGLARTAATELASSATLNIPGQAGPIVPVLQAQDGSFFGTVGTGPQPGQINQTNMIAFDNSGKVKWSVPNDSPKIATADGGVIGASRSVYDQNGKVTRGLANLPTYSWKGAYQLGSTKSVSPDFDLVGIATSFAPVPDSNLAGNGFSLVNHTFGLVFCSTDRGGDASACPGTSNMAFSYYPGVSDSNYGDAIDFSQYYPDWVETIKINALNSYKEAFDHFPALIAKKEYMTDLNGGATAPQSFDHTIYISGDWIAKGTYPRNDDAYPPNGYTPTQVPLRYSRVYYLAVMGNAQLGLGDFSVSPARPFSPIWSPPPISPALSSDFQKLVSAIGSAIGRVGVHETGHQIGLQYMECGKSNFHCENEDNYIYEFYSSYGGAEEWWYTGTPSLKWSHSDSCQLQQYLLPKSKCQ